MAEPESEQQQPARTSADKKKQQRLAYLIAGIGFVGVLIAWLSYRRQKGQQAAGGSAPAGPSGGGYSYPQVSGSGVVPQSAYDGSQASYDQSLLEAMNQLGQQVQNLGSSGGAGTGQQRPGEGPFGTLAQYGGSGALPLSSAPAGSNTAAEQLIGSGYYASGSETTPVSSGGTDYFHLSSMQQESAYAGSGGQVFYQPFPGVFQSVAGNNLSGLAQGTPLYGS